MISAVPGCSRPQVTHQPINCLTLYLPGISNLTVYEWAPPYRPGSDTVTAEIMASSLAVSLSLGYAHFHVDGLAAGGSALYK